ncbi:MAG: hypothetical protein ACXV5L_02275, partial [Thermoanaerobaculia bacterium]
VRCGVRAISPALLARRRWNHWLQGEAGSQHPDLVDQIVLDHHKQKKGGPEDPARPVWTYF